MSFRFTKMHGLGNDFVVIDAIHQQVDLTPEQIRYISNRRFGVGCDQLLMVEEPSSTEALFRYRIFNADGNEVEQCGNGARCFARFVLDEGLTDRSVIPVETRGGLITLRVQPDGQISVDMGVPRLDPDEIPFVAEKKDIAYDVEVLGRHYQLGVVSMGNPHAVLQVDNVQTAPVGELGPAIEGHERFPNRVNAGFMQVIDRSHIRLRVYERGAGETLACGTGACAAVVSGRLQGLLDDEVTVALPGGELVISWPGIDEPVIMTGPATYVFKGQIAL